MYHVVYFKCDASGDPVCTPDYYDDGAPSVNVIHWNTHSYTEYITAYAGWLTVLTIVLIRILVSGHQVLVLAWCPGQYANVNQVTREQYESCENLVATRARYGPASYTVSTDKPGTYYFANGVGEACEEGWKIRIVVELLKAAVG